MRAGLGAARRSARSRRNRPAHETRATKQSPRIRLRRSAGGAPLEIDPAPAADVAAGEGKGAKGQKAGKAAVHNPVRQVHFSSFIVQ